MVIKKPEDVPPREITPKSVYLDRRAFMRGAIAAGGTLVAAVTFRQLLPRPRAVVLASPQDPQALNRIAQAVGPYSAAALGEKPTALADIAGYNNYYEFSTDKYEVASAAKNWVPARPWTVEVAGLVKTPRTYSLDELLARVPTEERVYRMRCVEGWSMVIPWLGLPLGKLLAQLEPQSGAKFVEFTTLNDPEQLPNQKADVLDWPYVEALRIDEAMHELTLLATGIYGESLLNQNGAPLRLVVPWKYGFKGAKSIVKIRFTETMPVSTWMKAGPDEYGFYSNVNPDVAHPRWSQARERRIGETSKRKTLMFNGYADQVASLYAGMDLRKNF